MDSRIQHCPRRLRRHRSTWLLMLLVFYCTLLFIGTHLPPQHVKGLHASDKILHFLAYAGLAFLTASTFTILTTHPILRWLAITQLLAVYAAIDEFTQTFVGRSAEWMDWMADLAGVMAGLALYGLARILSGMLRPTPRVPYF